MSKYSYKRSGSSLMFNKPYYLVFSEFICIIFSFYDELKMHEIKNHLLHYDSANVCKPHNMNFKTLNIFLFAFLVQFHDFLISQRCILIMFK